MGRSRALSGTVCTRGGAAGARAAECGVGAGPSGWEARGQVTPGRSISCWTQTPGGGSRARHGGAGRGPESLPPSPRARAAHLALPIVIYEVKVLNEATSWSPGRLYAFY